MYDQVAVRAQMHIKEYEHRRARQQRPIMPHRASHVARQVLPNQATYLKWLSAPHRTRFRKSPMRTAMSLSVAFAAGWLIASIF